MKANRVIAWLTGILTLALALFSFILSFNALTDLAKQHGVSIPPLFPFVVEFAVIIFSLNALYRSLSKEPATWQWSLIIGSSILAGIFNVAHAKPDGLSRLIAAMPSLFLLLSFESFLNLIKHSVTRQRAVQSIAELEQKISRGEIQLSELDEVIAGKQAQIDQIENEHGQLRERIARLKIEQKSVQLTANEPIRKPVPEQTRLEKMMNLNKANEARQPNGADYEQAKALKDSGLTWPQVASELAVSISTARRWASKAEQSTLSTDALLLDDDDQSRIDRATEWSPTKLNGKGTE